MMKFPRPRILVNNEFPDLILDQPRILQDLVTKIVKPIPNSPEDIYLDQTIEFIKKKAAQNHKKVKLFNVNIGQKLSYVTITIPPHTDNILCLVDTGASNSLLHYKIAEKLQLKVKPTSMQMATATGTSSNAIIGTCHLTFQMLDQTGQAVSYCTNFIVARKLNGMQCILGAEFLLDESRVVSISAAKLTVQKLHTKYIVPITTDKVCPSLHNINIEEIISEYLQGIISAGTDVLLGFLKDIGKFLCYLDIVMRDIFKPLFDVMSPCCGLIERLF